MLCRVRYANLYGSQRDLRKGSKEDHCGGSHLTELGFADYVPEGLTVADEFKDQQKVDMIPGLAIRKSILTDHNYRLEKSVSIRWRQAV